MRKIKCVISENGTIIPIHNISAIAGEHSSHYVWTNKDIESIGYKLSDEQYNALLRELEYIEAKDLFEIEAEAEELTKETSDENVSIQINPSEYINDMGGNGCYLKTTAQASAKWSEEDNNAIKVLKNIIGKSEMIDSIIYTDGLKEKLYNWLKSLRPQKYVGYNPYKAAIESIAEMCKHYDVLSHSGLRDFYDNVKVKCKEPIEYDKEYFQKQWNPSEEQMKVLHNYAEQNNYDGAILTSLYNDLKQL